MGGGADSRIPRLLSAYFSREHPGVQVVLRTLPFDPQEAGERIAGLVAEYRPELVIGESLGACQAMRLRGVPRLFVSPSLNAPLYFGYLAAPLSLLPGVPALLRRLFPVKPGERQRLDFRFSVLRKFRRLRREALAAGEAEPGMCYAFFGTRDHYRRSGIVSICTWNRHLGKGRCCRYPGTHFMEEEFVSALLIPRIEDCLMLKNNE
ncbi:MAG: hypothetical protein J5871_02600 [Bacteroidales bacterium]|nr:hypothetical protein [Bacteroidales bacterium]